MDNGFINILKQLVSEQTSAALTDAKRCKALLADYTRNEYKKESRLLVQAVEAGVAKKIDGADADGLAACKKAQIRDLEEDYGLAPAVAAGVVNAIALVLRGDTDVTVSPSVEKAAEMPTATAVKPIAVVDKPTATLVRPAAVGVETIFDVGGAATSFTDPRDGQTYRTVKIGGLVWMAENLNYKTKGSWCYDNDESNGKKYGRLYTWDDAKVACPKGWHLPSMDEWAKLVDMAGGKAVAGKKLKSRSGWNNNGNGTDEFGFSALPGGRRGLPCFGFSGSFDYVGDIGGWWSAAEYGGGDAYFGGMGYDGDGVSEYWTDVRVGHSARCVEDCSVER